MPDISHMNPTGGVTASRMQSVGRVVAEIGAALRNAAAAFSAWASNGIEHVRRMMSERTAAPARPAVDPRRSVASVELADFSRSAPLDSLVSGMPTVEPNRPPPTLEQVKAAVNAWLAARDDAGHSGLARLLGPELRPTLLAANGKGGLEAVVALLTREGGMKDRLTQSAMEKSASMWTGRAFEMLLEAACKEPPAPAVTGLRAELLTLFPPPPKVPTAEADVGSLEPETFRRKSISPGEDGDQVEWRDTKHSTPTQYASSAEPSASSTAGPQSSSLSAASTEASPPLRDALDALQAWIGQHGATVAGQKGAIFRAVSIPAVAQLVKQEAAGLAPFMLDVVCPIQADGHRAAPTVPSPAAVVTALLQVDGSGRSRLAQMLGADARVMAGELFRALGERSEPDTQYWGVYNLVFLRGLGGALSDAVAPQVQPQRKRWNLLQDTKALEARQAQRHLAFMQASGVVQEVFRQAMLAGRITGAAESATYADPCSRLRTELYTLLGIPAPPERS
ncbi:hypothetical protein [Ramlibacter rhizophilus]|uniref:Uncharacterized protein n=1 Tax=Ramlibacter rhizophilus TaxID=1781167 RepID=A0A4Z0BDS5_9BURK|nr:hypothetical protein [Ramlibacter rhizophilus]TFY96274.1 hypothetical protein EZ242_21755 [Ramlibacter rhizophilus]